MDIRLVLLFWFCRERKRNKTKEKTRRRRRKKERKKTNEDEQQGNDFNSHLQARSFVAQEVLVAKSDPLPTRLVDRWLPHRRSLLPRDPISVRFQSLIRIQFIK